MREILFRGKRLDNGEWVEGDLAHSYFKVGDTCINQCKENLGFYQVDPDTVGQYTGLMDKNGKRIFEGDIYKYFDDEIQVVEWSAAFARMMLHTHGEREVKRGRKSIKTIVDGWCDLDDYPLEEMEYLGNTHDNPELLEGGVPDEA